MRLKNVLIVVNDMDRAIRFYKEIFGLQVILDQDGNVIMSEGLGISTGGLEGMELGCQDSRFTICHLARFMIA